MAFLAVAVDGSEPEVEGAADRYGFDWTIAYPESDWMGAAGTYAMPTTIWIDADGHIRRVVVGIQNPEDLDRWTAEIAAN